MMSAGIHPDVSRPSNRTGFVVLGFMVLLVLGAPFALKAETTRECPKDSPRCWYMVGGVGEAPKRMIFLARKVAGESVDGTAGVEFVQFIESVDFPEEYAVLKLQVDCERLRFSTQERYAGLRSGAVVRKPADPGKWTAMDDAQYGEKIVFPWFCAKLRQPGDPDLSAVFLDDTYRIPDLSQFLRKFMWGELDAG